MATASSVRTNKDRMHLRIFMPCEFLERKEVLEVASRLERIDCDSLVLKLSDKALSEECDPASNSVRIGPVIARYCDIDYGYSQRLFELPEMCDAELLLTEQANDYDTENVIEVVVGTLCHNVFKPPLANASGKRALKFINALTTPIRYVFSKTLESRVFGYAFRNTAIYKHHTRCEPTRNTAYNWCDKLLGLVFMLFFLLIVLNPTNAPFDICYFAIDHLRVLLTYLSGNPIGLKLNVALNAFINDCFSYHLDLWQSFLCLCADKFRYFYFVLSLFGAMGFSYQLACISDFISLLGFHAHCLHVYAHVIFNKTLWMLEWLWDIIIQKQKTFAAAYEYSNSQLYISIILFTSVVCFVPTIFVYYIVFSILQLTISALQKGLQQASQALCSRKMQILRQHALTSPNYTFDQHSFWQIFKCLLTSRIE